MYFVTGWPKIYRIDGQSGTPTETGSNSTAPSQGDSDDERTPEFLSRAIDIVFHEKELLFAIVCAESIYIWSGDQHRVLLGACHRTEASARNEGANARAFWHPELLKLVVNTTKGYVHFYTVVQDTSGADLFDYKLPRRRNYISLGSKYPYKITKDPSPVITGVCCMAVSGNKLSLATPDGRIVGVRWNGDRVNEFSVPSVPFGVAVGPRGPPLSPSVDTSGIDLVPPPSTPLSFGGARIVDVTFNSSLKTFGVVLSTGAAAVISLKKKASDAAAVTPAVQRWDYQGYWLDLPNKDAVVISLNARHRLAAIGSANGSVHIVDLSTPRPSYARTFSLVSYGVTRDHIGAVSRLRFSPDGHALAVGWAKRGLGLFSIFGCRLFTTVPLPPELSPFKEGLKEPLFHGTAALCWGAEGFHLLAAPHGASEIIQFSLLKSCLVDNPNMNFCPRHVLVGEDRLLFLTKHGKRQTDVTWQHVAMPTAYLADNWPIRHVSVNRAGTCLAIAGRHGAAVLSLTGKGANQGVAIHNTTAKRPWRLFGDRNTERQLRCAGLAWCDELLVFVNDCSPPNGPTGNSAKNRAARLEQSRYEVQCYPAGHLSSSALLCRVDLPRKHRPRLVDCNDDLLAVYTEDDFLFLFEIAPHENDESGDVAFVAVTLQHQVAMATGSPASLLLLPSDARVSLPQAAEAVSPPSLDSAKCLMLHADGRLTLSSAEHGGGHYELGRRVEQFWFGGATAVTVLSAAAGGVDTMTAAAAHDLSNTLWAYGEHGLQLWYPFFVMSTADALGVAQRPMRRDRSLEFDQEVFPIGFLPDLGVVVGVAQATTLHPACSPYPCYEISAKTHPFIHSILRHLLEEGEQAHALAVATTLAHLPHFSHSLELMLHESLEDESESEAADNAGGDTSPSTNNTEGEEQQPIKKKKRHIKSPNLVKRVVAFLRNFAQFPDIVVRCARKTDAVYWPELFEPQFVGSPVALFQECVEAHKVHSAASYLRIIQLLVGNAESRQCAYQLLEAVLETEDMELIHDLMRFLEPSDDIDPEQQKSLNMSLRARLEASGASETLIDERPAAASTGRLGPADGDDEVYFQEVLLARYARRLLSANRLYDLWKFAAAVGHELRPWLVRERTRAARPDDFTVALRALHVQYQVPFPEAFEPPETADGPNSHSPNDAAEHSEQPVPRTPPMPQRIREVADENPAGTDSPFIRRLRREDSGGIASNAGHGGYPLGTPGITSSFAALFANNEPAVDLAKMLDEMLGARCVEWSLLIATVMLRIDVIVSILREHNTREPGASVLWGKYEEALRQSKSQGYLELLHYLQVKHNLGR